MINLKHRDKREWEPLLGRMAAPGEIIGAPNDERGKILMDTTRWEKYKPIAPKAAKPAKAEEPKEAKPKSETSGGQKEPAAQPAPTGKPASADKPATAVGKEG